MTIRRGWTFAALLLLAGACEKDEEIVWVQFNGNDDVLEVEVTSEPDRVTGVSIDLHSTVGDLEVGEASIDPGAGPVGTEHQLSVVVDDAYESRVLRVTVQTDAGRRGVDEFELRQDSADSGTWGLVLESQGNPEPGAESRIDQFTILLWEPLVESDVADAIDET